MSSSVFVAIGLIALAACTASVDRADSATAAPVDSARPDSGTAASDECVRGEPEPVLVSGVAGRTARFERTGKLSATEDVQLDDSTSLRITHGGCAHYTESYAFTIGGAPRDTTDSDYWLRHGAELLQALAVREARTSQISELAKTLVAQAANADPYRYGEPIAIPELTTVTIVATQNDRKVVLEIVYDVAL